MRFGLRTQIRSRIDSQVPLGLLGAIVFAIVGVLLGGFGVHYRIEMARSASWVTVPFKIVDLSIDPSEGHSSADFFRFCSRYTYVFASRQYNGTRVRITGLGSSSKEYADAYEQLGRCKQEGGE